MLQVGQSETFPKLLFISNRLKIERLVEQGRRKTRGKGEARSDGEMEGKFEARRRNTGRMRTGTRSPRVETEDSRNTTDQPESSQSSSRKFSWLGSWGSSNAHDGASSSVGSPHDMASLDAPNGCPGDGLVGGRVEGRRGSRLEELSRQGSVIFGFGGSDESDSEGSGFVEVQGQDGSYIGSTGSEGGESDAYYGGDDAPELVEGGGRAVLY